MFIQINDIMIQNVTTYNFNRVQGGYQKNIDIVFTGTLNDQQINLLDSGNAITTIKVTKDNTTINRTGQYYVKNYSETITTNGLIRTRIILTNKVQIEQA